MNFEEALAELINQHIASEGFKKIIGALESKAEALRDELVDAAEDSNQ